MIGIMCAMNIAFSLDVYARRGRLGFIWEAEYVAEISYCAPYYRYDLQP